MNEKNLPVRPSGSCEMLDSDLWGIFGIVTKAFPLGIISNATQGLDIQQAVV